MFRLLQIDPETLAIHVNASAIARHKKADEMFELLRVATRSNPVHAVSAACNKGIDLDLLDFGSSLMHELRHFGDLLLSPFGFYRIRTAFEFYLNFPDLIFSSSGSKIPIPLMSGMDPVTRSVIGLSDDFEGQTAYQLGRTSLTRAGLINSENTFDITTGVIKIGGDRILEGLAYTSQFEFLFNDYNTYEVRKHFEKFFLGYTGTEFDQAYRWFIPYVHQLHPNETLPNNRLMQAILFASLCGSIPVLASPRRGPIQPKILPTRDVSPQLPSYRYNRLIEYFAKVPRPSLQSDEEAAFLVNYACEVLFGKGILEEIEEDIFHTDEVIASYREAFGDKPYEARQFNALPSFSALNNYRKHVFEFFKNDITSFTSPNTFTAETANFLQPSLIYNVSHGLEGWEHPPFATGNVVGLIDRHSIFAKESEGVQNRTIYSYWMPQVGDLNHEIGIDNAEIDSDDQAFKDDTLASLQILYAIYAPFYRWLLFGNRYLTMSEFENDNMIEAMNLNRDRFVIDAFYDEAQDISTPTAFFRFFGQVEMKCDICIEDVGEHNSFVVSARTVRQNQGLRQYFCEGDPENYRFLFERDWSDWLACTACMEKWNITIPRPIAKPTD